MLKTLKMKALLLLVCFAFEARAGSELEKCRSCHVEKESLASTFVKHPLGTSGADLQCYACHIQLIRGGPIQGFPQILRSSLGPKLEKKQTYAQARALMFTVQQSDGKAISKYNETGFFRYVQNPIARHPELTSSTMYPLGASQQSKLKAELKGRLGVASVRGPDEKTMHRGEELFTQNCVSCHGGQGPGPLLRLGVPLLSEAYITAVLEGKVRGLASTMPRFPQLQDADRKALAHYLQFAGPEKAVSKQVAQAADLMLPQEIYPKVLVPLFSSSCRHCHAESPEKQEVFQTLFGYERPIRFLMARTKRGYEPIGTGLTMLLPAAGSCEPSELLQRISLRHEEVRSGRILERPGMPLTMPPVPLATVDALRSWQRSGCFIDGKRLCEPCGKLKEELVTR